MQGSRKQFSCEKTVGCRPESDMIGANLYLTPTVASSESETQNSEVLRVYQSFMKLSKVYVGIVYALEGHVENPQLVASVIAWGVPQLVY